eukprot:759602-Hanusia_phi.AAC.1
MSINDREVRGARGCGETVKASSGAEMCPSDVRSQADRYVGWKLSGFSFHVRSLQRTGGGGGGYFFHLKKFATDCYQLA